MDDTELVKRAQRGNKQAIGKLYDQYQPHIYRFVWSRVQHQQTAEDMTGEIFMRMVKNLPHYQDSGNPFRAWLYRIARNLLTDYFRQSAKQVSLDEVEHIMENTESLEMVVQHSITITSVTEALGQIDPEQREVVVMRFLVGLPIKEVAISLNKTVPAVKSLQHRGLQALRAVLEQRATS